MIEKIIFIHSQAAVFENIISKNTFQWSNGSEYVSNMSHMIQIIILDGSYSHLDRYKQLKAPPPPKKMLTFLLFLNV